MRDLSILHSHAATMCESVCVGSHTWMTVYSCNK